MDDTSMTTSSTTSNTSNQYQNDEWTLTDSLGLGSVGDHVARMVLEVSPPFTIGITGKWGSGKTSILKRSYVTLGGLPLEQPLAFSAESSEESLGSKDLKFDTPNRDPATGWPNNLKTVAKSTRCVWFSPWQHQNEDNPLIPLLNEIKSQFTTWTKFKESAGTFNRKSGLAAAVLLERVTDAAISLTVGKSTKVVSGLTKDMQQAYNNAEPDVTAISDGQRFHLLFDDAIEMLLSADKKDDETSSKEARLVIFIDDLDRCEESIIVRLLESIKLYLSSKRCVFVLGLDDTAVIDALGRHWERSEDLNREYLEKLFQSRVPVPLPHPEKIKNNIKKQLEAHNINTIDVIDFLDEDLVESIDVAKIMTRDIEHLLEPNPRKVKNFVNSLCITWSVLGASGWVKDDTEARQFVLFHYLQQYHRSIWRLLERQPKALHFLWGVLTSTSEADIMSNTPDGFTMEDQGLLIEIFRRAFSHVLKNHNVQNIDDNKHGTEELDCVVGNFLQRQDRKRSDEYLCKMFKELVYAGDTLNEHYLYAGLV
jgi:hypothetical protein